MNSSIWVSGDIPRLDGCIPSCATPAATRLVSFVRGPPRGDATMCREPIAPCGLQALTEGDRYASEN
jgi:hypothetical protein